MPSRTQPGTELDPALLSAYLLRAGWHGLVSVASRAATETEARLELERAMLKRRNRLPISPEPAEMRHALYVLLGESSDLVLRDLEAGEPPRPGLLVYLSGMADKQVLQSGLTALLSRTNTAHAPVDPEQLLDWLAAQRSNVPGARVETSLSSLIRHILDGHAAVFVQGSTRALQLVLPGYTERAIQEPETESVIRGPREGFVETASTNISLVRRRLRDERLRVETHTVGSLTQSKVVLLYVAGLCKPALVEEARSRLRRIKTDVIIDSGYIEEFIEDTPWTVFPLVKATERPDVVTAALSEGRIALMVEGSPFALVVPTSLTDQFQAPEDYYERFPVVFALRVMRWFFASLALMGPSFYVAFTTFHQEMIPTQFLLSIMAAREGVPFPAVVEALIMEVAFESLREAGVRLPRPIGQSISIVGALVIGQAAVEAGIVSAPMVIVVALTGISSFIIPKVSAAIAFRMLRFPLLILAGTLGAYGLTLGVLAVLIHLLSLRSFGAPYYAPLGPWLPPDHDDLIYRAPHWANRTRPAGAESMDPIRTGKGLKPGPDHKEGE